MVATRKYVFAVSNGSKAGRFLGPGGLGEVTFRLGRWIGEEWVDAEVDKLGSFSLDGNVAS